MSFLSNRRARIRAQSVARGTYDYELAALHLQLLVAMATADHELRAVEVERLAQFVGRVGVPERDRPRLEQLLCVLIDAPPKLETMLRQIIDCNEGKGVAEIFVTDLVAIAKSDDYVDHREETLLRMVCGAFGLPPETLHARAARPVTPDETEQLRSLVHAMVADVPPAA
jgi:tellurite resistance protein